MEKGGHANKKAQLGRRPVEGLARAALARGKATRGQVDILTSGIPKRVQSAEFGFQKKQRCPLAVRVCPLSVVFGRDKTTSRQRGRFSVGCGFAAPCFGLEVMAMPCRCPKGSWWGFGHHAANEPDAAHPYPRQIGQHLLLFGVTCPQYDS